MGTHRLLFLGAGFSVHAGFPVGSQLFELVNARIQDDHGVHSSFSFDLERYIEYQQLAFGRELLTHSVDLEDFLGFLDVEHYLGLQGSDTLSSDGNATQLMVRRAIAQVLIDAQPSEEAIPNAYRRFARQLTPSDYICTFNYDTLLETALELENQPYRLSYGGWQSDEVTILKLHGSVDWYSRAAFDEEVTAAKDAYQVRHPIFGDDAVVDSERLWDGVYRVRESEKIVQGPSWMTAPYLLSPSTQKLFYVNQLSQLWRNLSNAGGYQLSMGIVGYSLPRYDDYAQQIIYQVARNYQHFEPDLSLGDRKKSKVRIVDYLNTSEEEKQFRDRYRFLDWDRTEVKFSGFDSEAADWILR